MLDFQNWIIVSSPWPAQRDSKFFFRSVSWSMSVSVEASRSYIQSYFEAATKEGDRMLPSKHPKNSKSEGPCLFRLSNHTKNNL